MLKLDEMELDILELVYEKSDLEHFIDVAKGLNAKYPSVREQQALLATSQYLLEARYLWPYFGGNTGEELRDYVREITPKGVRRLRELQHPVRSWIWGNWFPLVVATITAAIAIANIVVDITANMASPSG